MPTLLDDALLSETLQSLPGWEGGADGIWREVHLTDEQDAELRRQVTVDADAMGHHPAIERVDGATRYTLRSEDAGGVTELDIAFASHLSDLVHRISGDEPGIDAVSHDDPLVVQRPGEGAGESTPK